MLAFIGSVLWSKCHKNVLCVCCFLFASVSFVALPTVAASTPAIEADAEQAAQATLKDRSLVNQSRNALLRATDNKAVVEDSARSLFVASGLFELIEQIPISTAESFEQALTVDSLPIIFSDIDQTLIRNAVRSAFKFETFDKYMVGALRNTMSDVERGDMLDWYVTDLGARVRKAELQNSLLTEQKRFEEYQTYLTHYPAGVVRQKVIESLDATMRSTESAVDMMLNIQIAFNLSLSRFLPEEQRLSRHEILGMVRQHEQELLSQYREQTKDVLLFTYHDLSDDDLSELDEQLASNSGQAFVAAINDGIKKAMFAASLDLGDELGALLNTPPTGPGI